MSHVVITVEISSKERVDLAVPLNVPNQVLAPALAKLLELSEEEDKSYLLAVKTQDGIVRLAMNTTLGQAGILDGFVLQLQRRKGIKAVPKSNAKAFLQAESGEVFSLTTGSTLVGRQDAKRGIFVEIDLKPFDIGKTISRRHAKIECKEEKYELTDLGSVNGTCVNGTRLPANEPLQLKTGDVIEFGRGVMGLTFRMQ
jgi:hypothetical protein